MNSENQKENFERKKIFSAQKWKTDDNSPHTISIRINLLQAVNLKGSPPSNIRRYAYSNLT
jgi:hypothetical protein